MISAFGVDHGSDISKLAKPNTGFQGGLDTLKNAATGLFGGKRPMVQNVERKTAINNANKIGNKKKRNAALVEAKNMPKGVTGSGYDTGADARKWMKKNPLATAGIATGAGVGVGAGGMYGASR